MHKSLGLQADFHPGDQIYVFSDGYPDQFGGPDMRKLKISGMRELLEEVEGLPMAKQQMILEKKFHDWKGDTEQIDDVLFIGIKV